MICQFFSVTAVVFTERIFHWNIPFSPLLCRPFFCFFRVLQHLFSVSFIQIILLERHKRSFIKEKKGLAGLLQGTEGWEKVHKCSNRVLRRLWDGSSRFFLCREQHIPSAVLDPKISVWRTLFDEHLCRRESRRSQHQHWTLQRCKCLSISSTCHFGLSRHMCGHYSRFCYFKNQNWWFWLGNWSTIFCFQI